ncbi:MAG: serine--tRNA ligase [Bacilli bacterium]
MLDIKRIVNDKEKVEKALQKRMIDISLDDLVNWYQERNKALVMVEQLKANKNKLNKEIGELKAKGEDISDLSKKMKNTNNKINELELQLTELENNIKDLLVTLPNIPDDDVVAGGKENNEVISIQGEKPNFNFRPKNHVDLMTDLGLVDFERGTKLSGHGYWIYTNMGARLEWALINYFIDTHLKNGYEFLLVPHILGEKCGYAAGQFPKFREDVFHLTNDDGFLLPTAETALVNYYRNEILDYQELPKRFFSYTPCYRKEAGSHRTEERGTVRGHQFNKVEMFTFTTKEQSDDMHQELIRNGENILKGLGLHFRVSKLAAADVSASMAKTYDLEVWIPSMNEYKEVSSISNARDYQTRRGMIRYKSADGTNEYAHTLNGSGLATSRLLPAIVEQFQNEDGSVTIPEVLRPYMGGLSKITK